MAPLQAVRSTLVGRREGKPERILNWGGLTVWTFKLPPARWVDVVGRITLGGGGSTFRETVRDLISKGNKKVLLNLGEVSYIDSSGIGELVSAFTTVTNRGGVMKLLNLTKRVQGLLQITKLYTVFEVFDSETSAMHSFA